MKEINLSKEITTEDLLSQIYALKDVDGIQLMWPLPSQIDTQLAYIAIAPSRDIDGIHYIGQKEIGAKSPFPPVTPAATMALIDHYNIELEGVNILVIGRSPIVGAPLAHLLRERDAVVTVVHSTT